MRKERSAAQAKRAADGVSPRYALRGAVALSDAVGRLALPAALLGLARDAPDPALLAALVASGAAVVRAFTSAHAVRLAMVEAWEEATRATRCRPFEALPRRREDQESVATLLDGVHEQATFRAVLVPQAIGLSTAAVGVTVGAFAVLGVGPTLAGGVLLALMGALVGWLGRGLRRAQQAAWADFGRLAREMRVLVEGAVELRATGREEGVAEQVVVVATDLARHEARATSASARLALLPASLALVAGAAPLRAGVAPVVEALGGPRLFETTILGGAAVALAFGAARAWEQWSSTEPRRARFLALVEAASVAAPARTALAPGSLAEVPMVFEHFAHDHNGDGHCTPHDLDLAIPPRAGIALTGPNGTGKTTAALALLGVVTPTSGSVRIHGVEAHRIDRRALRGRVAFVPQDPLLVPGESIAWHCRLHEDDPPSDEEVDAALARVGLAAALVSRGRARGLLPRELPASELSGGERRRLALARALCRTRELYVLDEPEAGLDLQGRAELLELLDRLVVDARVLLIVHDPTVIPQSFRQVRLVSS